MSRLPTDPGRRLDALAARHHSPATRSWLDPGEHRCQAAARACHIRWRRVALGEERSGKFNTRAKRLGKVILVSDRGIRAWRLHDELQQAVGWTV